MPEPLLNENLTKRFETRHHNILTALDHVKRTKSLFSEYGSPELESKLTRLDSMGSAMESDNVKLVVIGEFSRGKSALINALLGTRLLPTAYEQTTAINAFIQAVPEGSSPYIVIHFKDSEKQPLRIEWNDSSAYEKWGTELEKDNRDNRLTVERIEAFSDHPLLKNGLVLIDTPGLEGVIEHHKNITLQAIDQAHMAIWVLSAGQLGGTLSEWEFLIRTIRQNFRKFVTVINMWDKIIEPEDEQDKQKPDAEREIEKLNKVRDNFRRMLLNASAEELNTLTSSENLMGVSAKWGLSDDPEKRRLSRIDVLSGRIADLCTGKEAMKEILYKPLQQLQNIQSELRDDIAERLNVLKSSQDIAERRRNLEILEKEIRYQEIDQRNSEKEARDEHKNAAIFYAKEIQEKLVEPLKELKIRIEQYLTREYVSAQIDKKMNKIVLPEKVQLDFEQAAENLKTSWEEQKQNIKTALSDLGVSYENSTQRNIGKIHSTLDGMQIKIPDLHIQLSLDLSEVENYHQSLLDIENKILEKEIELNDIEKNFHAAPDHSLKIQMAKDLLSYARKRLDLLGPPPPPIRGTRKEQIEKGGIYTSPKFETFEYIDDSNVKTYLGQKQELEKILAQKEADCNRVIDEVEKKTGERLTAEAAIKKLEQEIAKMQRKADLEKKKAEKVQQDAIDAALQKFSRDTVGELDKRISLLEKHVKTSILQVFDKHLELLLNGVKEQFTEPLKAKYSQRDEAIKTIEQGELETRNKVTILENGLNQIEELISLTSNILVNG